MFASRSARAGAGVSHLDDHQARPRPATALTGRAEYANRDVFGEHLLHHLEGSPHSGIVTVAGFVLLNQSPHFRANGPAAVVNPLSCSPVTPSLRPICSASFGAADSRVLEAIARQQP